MPSGHDRKAISNTVGVRIGWAKTCTENWKYEKLSQKREGLRGHKHLLKPIVHSWHEKLTCCSLETSWHKNVLDQKPPLPFVVLFIHPSIFYTCFIQLRVVGGLEPIPAVTGWEAGYTLDRSPGHHRATQRQTTMPTHTQEQFRIT